MGALPAIIWTPESQLPGFSEGWGRVGCVLGISPQRQKERDNLVFCQEVPLMPYFSWLSSGVFWDFSAFWFLYNLFILRFNVWLLRTVQKKSKM